MIKQYCIALDIIRMMILHDVGIGGTRLVSARRPITPREPRRQLYGRLAPPGRPPSAINLKYLQQGANTLPSLEPIQLNSTAGTAASSSLRSDSIDVKGSISIGSEPAGHSSSTVIGREKLPALANIPQKLSGSFENSKYWNWIELRFSLL